MSITTNKMRILFLADAVFEDLPGGSGLVARELAAGLGERGHDVTFLVARHSASAPDDERHGPIRIVRYEGAGKGLEFIRKGRDACERLCAEKSFDLVHTHFAYASLGPLRAVPKSVPRIRTFHGPWDEEGWLEDSRKTSPVSFLKATVKRRVRFEIEERSLCGSAKVLTLSECFAKMARSNYGVRSERIDVIPGGTDIKRFCLAKDKTAVRKRLGLPQDRRILLTVRRLAPRMGLDNLVKAMAVLAGQHRDSLLLIGGTGPERDRLVALIKAWGLESHIRLIGFIPDQDLAAYYQASDLFVLPTAALEGFGLVITEALACGVPVIGTPVGAIPEILGDLDLRLIAAGTDPFSLVTTIDRFLHGKWTDHLTPQRLRTYVVDRYTWDRHVGAVEAAYSGAIELSRNTYRHQNNGRQTIIPAGTGLPRNGLDQ